MQRDVLQALATERRTYDLVLCDPPYGYADHERLAPYLVKASHPHGLLVYETGAREEPQIQGLSSTYLPHVRLRAPYSVRT